MHPRLLIPALAASATLALSACSPAETAETTSTSEAGATGDVAAVWDKTVLHTFEIDYDESDFDDLIDAYLDDGDKVWITATVTIDGVTYEDAGLKLKGNSSLRGITADSDPATLPWIVRLDRFVEGQSHDGATEFAIRGNSSQTSLNEAVALDLLEAAGLAAQEAIAISLTIEGSDPTLRLVVENPDDAWMERELGDGSLYKAEAGGDYGYRGDDDAAYDGVFDQEGGGDDLAPLIDFLAFLDESDDATFAAELPDRLDVDAFATYLAYQELVVNSDDIDGPGNNSYLYYDPDSARMTVVNWDLNLAFGATPGSGGAPGDAATGGAPGDGTMRGPGMAPDGPGGARGDVPADAAGGPDAAPDTILQAPDAATLGEVPAEAAGGRAGPGGMGSNVLAERFLANEEFAALVDAELERLTQVLYDSGLAEASLDDWTQLLLDSATGLVPADTIEQESADLASRFPA